MKKMITTILILSLFTTMLTAPPFQIGYIARVEPLQPYEALWKAACIVESGCDESAIGDRKLRHKSYGIVQIRKSRLDDYYRQTGIRYNVKDMFDVEKSKEVFLYYCTTSDLEVIARTWNGGPDGMEKKSTLKYWNKIKEQLN